MDGCAISVVGWNFEFNVLGFSACGQLEPI